MQRLASRILIVVGVFVLVIAVVGLDEQKDLRLSTNIVGCDPWSVAVGQRVKVAFLERHGYFYPLFRPAR